MRGGTGDTTKLKPHNILCGMFASGMLRVKWGRYMQVLGNSLKSTYTDSCLYMCFVNASYPANMCQLRSYLLLTASLGKPTLCLVLIGKPWQIHTAKENVLPCLHCPPFQGQRGSRLLPSWCERCCPKMWHPWFHIGWALNSSGWQWQKTNRTDLPIVAAGAT